MGFSAPSSFCRFFTLFSLFRRGAEEGLALHCTAREIWRREGLISLREGAPRGCRFRRRWAGCAADYMHCRADSSHHPSTFFLSYYSIHIFPSFCLSFAA
ncbi:uncharacterized protein EI97DRAFT_414254 [Westerdykella ornata]|uniref:Uncharacterized protein n=1 Tax=Westerdykella ornata TaxID=318751 RepID=A0A6A6JS85_WESOR|nr:uncharacterized protein EI97DRAFT_414254 [Westerdykella ornata]KAF2279124.1 hypothetical protein EI97DRAFT_414254 [Westerdykella ornata]